MAEIDAEEEELIQEFLVECYEGLDQLDQDLVSLEDDPGNAEILSGIFRAFHTIKGTSGFLAFGKLESVAHAAENLLSKLRDGLLELDRDRTSALLHSVDALRAILACIEETHAEGDGVFGDLIAELGRLQEAAPAERVPPKPAGVEETPKGSDARPSATNASIRVDVDLLDSLMNLVGELVLARNQILQHTASDVPTGLSRTTQRLNLITSDLQEGVMKTRMQPIRNVWNKFPRVVRDLTRSCGKKASIRMEGADTELDRTILEAIKDPLTHMVRNSVDHGLETAEERLASGKPEEGTLVLRAYHEGGQVNLELADDGRGIDVQKIGEKAVEKGVVSRDRLERMSEREVLQLVFLPGFSTATTVTNVSGRGVGMDVVRTNIEKIGGAVDLQSTRGVGTTVRVKIPLTLAIIPALLVSADGNRYAIPQVSLIELVRIEGKDAATAIEHVHGAPVYRLRGRLLPLVDLRAALEAPAAAPPDDPADGVLEIVVLQADERHYGLVVDGVSDTEEIVVKPLGHPLRDVPLYAGATIMGDGRVALILDALGIAESAGVLVEHASGTTQDAEHATAERTLEHQTLLLLELEDGRRAAIPLSAVSRLEDVDTDRIERAGDHWVTQYRDEIMPLVALGDPDRLARGGDRDALQIIVHNFGDRRVGLVVERIHDIVDTRVQLSEATRRRGTLGSAIVQGQVMDLLDVEQLITDAIPGMCA